MTDPTPDGHGAEDSRAEDPMASVRPYLELASGLLGMSAAKAAELAQGLWTQGGDAVSDVVGTAAEQGGQVVAMLSPEQVRGMVREEVDRLVRRLSFAREDELASLRREVGRLEQQVSALGQRIDDLVATSVKDDHDDAKPGKKHGKKHKSKKDSS